MLVHTVPLNHLQTVDIAEFDSSEGHDYVEQHGIPLTNEGLTGVLENKGYTVNDEHHVLVAIPPHLFPTIPRIKHM